MPFNDAPVLECYDRMKAALDDIAKQKLVVEMSTEEWEHADFQGAYEIIVTLAREALS